ncbi:LysM peptidoglycan-binding domain-containing M23 family metallopeptidase [uncultured Chloroflexus sp.]|uniref:LysM peptidoglycan-binding domain-containing M23 family metallopeptidase n=1 Tax=uncultured Chloroflexus sp. TaxID=214040 RepID=UPI00261B6BB7|nr:LysM peptidoglycan-binding domain-containing M23 family metallopeptidase [uncultured Chloroflexus sp.]
MQVIFEQPPWYERWVRSQRRLAAARRTARRLREGQVPASDALLGRASRRVVRWQIRPSRHIGHLLLLAAVILILATDRTLQLQMFTPVTHAVSEPVVTSLLPAEQVVVVAPAVRQAAAPSELEPIAPAVRAPIPVATAYQTTHLLAEGETLAEVAARYQIPLSTLVWTNQLDRGDALRVGQPLRIARLAGAAHTVSEGETLTVLAERYGVAPEAIATFAPNRLRDGQLIVGREIFIPGGRLPWTAEQEAAFAHRTAEPVGIVLADETNVRSGPTTDHPRQAQLAAGRQVALRGRYNDWVKIAIGDVTGWIRSDLLESDPAVVAALPEVRDFPPPPPRWVWPARGMVTSGFGPRWGGFHNGIDIANAAWTPIVAASRGWVYESGWCSGYGYCVKIRHPGGIETIYGHLITKPVVRVGQEVSTGQLIGYMGSTYDRAGGGYSTGVHLHFTILVNGRAVNPLRYLP